MRMLTVDRPARRRRQGGVAAGQGAPLAGRQFMRCPMPARSRLAAPAVGPQMALIRDPHDDILRPPAGAVVAWRQPTEKRVASHNAVRQLILWYERGAHRRRRSTRPAVRMCRTT